MQGKDTVASVKKGDVLDVTEVKGDWFGVAPTLGWIHKSNVRFEATAAPLPAAPPSTTPPALPPLPADMGWDEYNQKAISERVANAGTDPVAAYLQFQEFLGRKEKQAPTPKQKQWLDAASACVKPQALAVVKKDFKAFVDAKDLRGSLLVMAVADKIEKGCLQEPAAAVAAVKSAAMSGAGAPAVWKITDVRGTRIGGTFHEGAFQQEITLTAKAGFQFVRVTATAENTSAASDPRYALWALDTWKRLFRGINDDDKGKQPGPSRMAIDEFVYLLTPAMDWIACVHVCESSPALRGPTLTIRSPGGAGGMVFPGTDVKQGEKFQIDVLFAAPQGINDFRLLILGSPPVPVKMESK
jgi:hypothetical protein